MAFKSDFLKYLPSKVSSQFYSVVILFIFCYAEISGQTRSAEYKAIKQSTDVGELQKKIKIDSLFSQMEEQGRFLELVADVRDYAIENYFKSQIGQAISYLEKADTICQKLEPPNEEYHRRIIFNLASFHRDNGEHTEAIEIYKRLINSEIEDDLSAEAHSKIGLNYMELGDFYQSVLYHEQAHILLKKRKMPLELIVNSNDVANAYVKIDDRHLTIVGIKRLMKAEVLNDSLIKSSNKPMDRLAKERTFNLYINLAKLLHDEKGLEYLGDTEDYYNKALNIAKIDNDSSRIARTLSNLGALYKSEGRLDSADTFLSSAYGYSSTPDQQSLIYLNRSEIALLKNQLAEALTYSEKSIALATNWHEQNVPPENINISNYYTVYNKLSLLKILRLRVEIWKAYFENNPKEKYLQNAYQLVNISDALIDNIRRHSVEIKSKLFWQMEATSLYTQAVNICYLKGKIDRAYYFMEKNKAVLLLEDRLYKRQKRALLPQEVLSKDTQFKRSILDMEKVLSHVSKDQKDSVISRLFDQKNNYSKFTDSLRYVYHSHQFQSGPVKILDYNMARKEGKTLEYILPYDDSQSNGYVLFIDNDKEILHEIDDVALLNKKVDEYREFLLRPFRTSEDRDNFIAVSSELYNLLIPNPINELIKESDVVIIPDGRLQNIPFEALIDGTDDNKYLIESVNISYAYSMSFSKENQVIERNPKKLFLGFAPINFDYYQLTSLKESAVEITEIAELLEGDSFLEQEALSSRFKDIVNDYKIVHLSTHADANDSIAPWIAFSDTLVTLNDLYTLNTEAELIVLSACNTARGKLQTGEGVMSLARGFFHAGANSVLPSLWNVNDKSGRQIISQFYTNLKAGDSKSIALRKAKLSYLENHDLSSNSPYYWASHILIGDADNIEFTSEKDRFWLVFAMVITFLCVVLLFVWRRKTKSGM